MLNLKNDGTVFIRSVFYGYNYDTYCNYSGNNGCGNDTVRTV